MLATLDGGRLSIGSMGLGGAQGAYDLALKYAKEREQFGQPISKFQAIAFKLADCAMEIECGRNLLYKACWLRDKKRAFAKEAAMAKLVATEASSRVVDRCMQMFGGLGVAKDLPFERWYREMRIRRIGEGLQEPDVGAGEEVDGGVGRIVDALRTLPAHT